MFKTSVFLILSLLIGTVPVSAERLFTSGFELQNATNGVEWYSSDTLAASGTIATDIFRTGLASGCVVNPTSSTRTGFMIRYASSGVNGVDYFLRTYFYVTLTPPATTAIMAFSDSASSTIGRVSLNSDRTLSISFDAGGSLETVGPSVETLTEDTWHLLELRVRRDATAPNSGADQGELRLDGVSILSSSTLNISTTISRAMVGANLNADAVDSFYGCFDDVAINNSVGTFQNSWPGAGSVYTLFPNGAGDATYTQSITLNDAFCVTPAATAWESVDDKTTTGTGDDFADCISFTSNATTWTGTGSRVALALENVPSADTISLVSFNIRTANLSSSNSAYVLSGKVGGTLADDSTNVSFAHATEWLTNQSGTVRVASPYTMYTTPSKTAWSSASVNALEFLIRGQDTTPRVLVTATWANVDMIPSVGGDPGGSGAGLLLLLGVQ